MQKVFNALAVVSFVMSASTFGAAFYVYNNRESLIERVKEETAKAVTETVTAAVPGIVKKLLPPIPKIPKFPSETGNAFPFLR